MFICFCESKQMHVHFEMKQKVIDFYGDFLI